MGPAHDVTTPFSHAGAACVLYIAEARLKEYCSKAGAIRIAKEYSEVRL